MSRRVVVFPGERYGRLVVVAEAGCSADAKRLYLCRCDCGARPVVKGKSLRNGDTSSCGCLHRELVAALGRSNATHGHSRNGALSPTYQSWVAMRRRCTEPANKDWHLYGGAGVTICPTWRRFDEFLLDMGERPPGHTLDRIDPWGDYTPSNCRWATPLEQRHNRRAAT